MFKTLPLAVGTLALLLWTTTARADDYRLGGGTVDVPTINLMGSVDNVETVPVHFYRRFGFRPYYFSYRPFYYRPYFSYSFYPRYSYFYPRYFYYPGYSFYYPRYSFGFNYFGPRFGFYYYSTPWFYRYYYGFSFIDADPAAFPPAVTLGSAADSPYAPYGEMQTLPPPRESTGTNPNGLPANPQPQAPPARSPAPKVVPYEGYLASLPSTPFAGSGLDSPAASDTVLTSIPAAQATMNRGSGFANPASAETTTSTSTGFASEGR